MKNGLKNKPPVFLAIDNVGDSQSSRDEAQSFVKAILAFGSKVLVTSRSGEVLESVLGHAKYCKPIPRLEEHEATKLFLSVAILNKTSLALLKHEECKIVEKCLKEFRFIEDGYPTSQYHPLVLRALGVYFHDVDKYNVKKWEEVLGNTKKVQQSRELGHVNNVLGLNYNSLPEMLKLAFMDLAFYIRYNLKFFMSLRWWEGVQSDFELCVAWLATLHGVVPSQARMMVSIC